MRIEKNRVRAPEIGRIWINSPPLNLRQLRGRVVLADFWDYTCVNCIRTLPYLKAWHERYRDAGLVVIGVHTPEFTFAQYESNVERGVREFGLTYPIVVDSNYELWKAFANRYWPAKYLIDSDGYLRYAHFGEGEYQETERVIQELLLELHPDLALPKLMAPLRDTDMPGAVCFPPSPELYLGYRRGRIGNTGGFKEGEIADYNLEGIEAQDTYFYAEGSWSSTAEFLESAGSNQRLIVPFEAAGVNLVMNATSNAPVEVALRLDGEALTPDNAGNDVGFRKGTAGNESYVTVTSARMYSLVENRAFSAHLLELRCQVPGLAVYAFTFTSCADPAASPIAATAPIAGTERA